MTHSRHESARRRRSVAVALASSMRSGLVADVVWPAAATPFVQVSFLRTAMTEATALLESHRNCKLSVEDVARMHDEIKLSLRRAYVNTWSAPHLRWVLANTSNIMIWSFDDVGGTAVCGVRPGGGGGGTGPASPIVVRMAMDL